MNRHPKTVCLFFIIFLLLPLLSQAQDKVQPGKFIVEPPTLENLGFEWYIDGDEKTGC